MICLPLHYGAMTLRTIPIKSSDPSVKVQGGNPIAIIRQDLPTIRNSRNSIRRPFRFTTATSSGNDRLRAPNPQTGIKRATDPPLTLIPNHFVKFPAKRTPASPPSVNKVVTAPTAPFPLLGLAGREARLRGTSRLLTSYSAGRSCQVSLPETGFLGFPLIAGAP